MSSDFLLLSLHPKNSVSTSSLSQILFSLRPHFRSAIQLHHTLCHLVHPSFILSYSPSELISGILLTYCCLYTFEILLVVFGLRILFHIFSAVYYYHILSSLYQYLWHLTMNSQVFQSKQALDHPKQSGSEL